VSVEEHTAPALLVAVRNGDIAGVRRLLAEGANPRLGDGRELPLHVAAQRGPLELVDALIAGGALEWQPDGAGRRALEAAQLGTASDKAAIVALLECAITDAAFRAAVAALHAGDVAELARLLDAEPRLLHERIVGPEAYRRRQRPGYFQDPKLFWFVANNPTLVERMPPNMPDVARVMIERGVDRADLTYALELTMTSSVAREQGLQRPLMRVLLDAGAEVTRDSIVVTAAHWELDALRALVERGRPIDVLLAAAFGDEARVRALLPGASADDVQTAFGLAAINRNNAVAALALDAGADVNAFLPVHSHSTALHQAATDDNVALIELLVERGARTDLRDTLWDATPLQWAIHGKRSAAVAALERIR
jgi:Ankyrin repeats (3 copies)